jgi:DNA-directed RNA polymerase specialized sigma24 family protein
MKNGDVLDYREMEADIPDNESIEDDLNCRSLRALIEKVTEVYPDARRIIMLRYQGLTDSEIERVTGIRKYVFQYRIKRALQNLDFQLEDYR